ncbi:hypothetical protein Patl1_26900 [Pistacia atlantica]|uniref:Uncharacterized protein n=1 Tax=Pistacia atlantica TaxID=434234 RepID=A0ACC1B413_9ROSI|nr:hypothetical protein Patl1_26900 [Pistacia atlantica]
MHLIDSLVNNTKQYFLHRDSSILQSIGLKGLKLTLLPTTSSTTTSNFIQTKATSINIEIISDGIDGKSRSMPLIPHLKINDLPSFLDGTDSYPSLLKLVVSQFSNIEESKWLFCNTFDKLEDEVNLILHRFI